MKRLVLVRPNGPRNVGSVLRLTANFGPAELVLVRPERPALLLHPEFEMMAHGVGDGRARVRVEETLAGALAACSGSYGFTARVRDHREIRDWRDARAEIVARAQDPSERIALVFGNEDDGLSAPETEPLGALVRFPTSPEHGSINLAMAAGIVLSTIFFERAPDARAPSSAPLSGDERAFLIARLRDALGARTTSAPARRDLGLSIERVFARAPLETRDARAWHLLARALGNEKTPGDYGLAIDARAEEPA
ncbi:MAG: RNA methyltransferase [Actinobacteria bacterium]|nr:RNA methyltransferase [Actinomycetota bacterium]